MNRTRELVPPLLPRLSFAGDTGVFVRLGGALLDALVPPICQSCRKPLAEPRSLCASCWSELELVSAPICPVLGTPLAFDAGPGARSPELKWNHPLYELARTATVFGPVSQRLVHQLKYHDVPGVAKLMARLMAPAIADALAGADVLIPVPLHRGRLARRRFNQAVMIADELSALVGLPVARHAVARIKATRQQVGLKRDERSDNLHRAFLVREEAAVRDRTVVIVDDVLTTGATADALALTLSAAGAKAVRVAVFARVVGENREPT